MPVLRLPDTTALSDDQLLEQLQNAAFNYFVERVDATTGLVADTSRKDSPASIAVVGICALLLSDRRRARLDRARRGRKPDLEDVALFLEQPARAPKPTLPATRVSITISSICGREGASGNVSCR